MEFLSPVLNALDLAYFMRQALNEAEQAGLAGELPIGAVVVIDGEIISRGRASHQGDESQLSHAELKALRAGGKPLWTSFDRAILFTTVEPCPMCLGAAVMADVPHIIFALHDRGVFSASTVETNPYVHRHIQSYQGGVLEADSAALMARFKPNGLEYLQTGILHGEALVRSASK